MKKTNGNEARPQRGAPILHPNAHEAIREANGFGVPVGIAYRANAGWLVYELASGTRDEPELLCLGQGRIPIPLSEAGEIIIDQLIARRRHG